MRKFLRFLIVLSAISFSVFAAEKPKTVKRVDSLIAVFDFDVQGNVDKSIARSLADSVRIEIINSGKYEVIDRSNMDKILKEQAFQMTGCAAKECAVEAGQMLGVGKIVVGTVGLIGKTYYLTLSLVNVETGKTELIKDEECRCEVDALISSSKRVAKGLMGQAMPPKPQVSSVVEQVLTTPTITGAKYTDSVSGMEFVFVKGGCFLMGDIIGIGSDNERPVHEVCVEDFYMGKYEVTQGQWKGVMGNNPSKNKGGDDFPTENVSWDDVQIFILKLKKMTGNNYRLPTEAEWEYAARSGGNEDKWAGTNNVEELRDYAWYKKRFSGENTTHGVGLKKPNALRLYDMTGNVEEWVHDFYGEKYYVKSPRSNPTGPSEGGERVARGGSWDESPDNKLRITSRVGHDPSRRENTLGFRLLFR